MTVLEAIAYAVGGFLLGRYVLGPPICHLLERLIRRRLDRHIGEAFDTARRDTCADEAYVDQVFADIAEHESDLNRCRDLSAYYLPGKVDPR